MHVIPNQNGDLFEDQQERERAWGAVDESKEITVIRVHENGMLKSFSC